MDDDSEEDSLMMVATTAPVVGHDARIRELEASLHGLRSTFQQVLDELRSSRQLPVSRPVDVQRIQVEENRGLRR